MFSTGKTNISIQDLRKIVDDATIASYYLNVPRVPYLTNSPLREDKNPSFGYYSKDGIKISWKDFTTKEGGGLIDLLSLMWNCSIQDTITKIIKDLTRFRGKSSVGVSSKKARRIHVNKSESDLECKIRDWKDYDIAYWESYGISLEWLKYAEVYPISHKIVISDNKRYTFNADKYAYVYVEHKEGKVTLKIYQPYNKQYKWSNKHDKSVISLWTKRR